MRNATPLILTIFLAILATILTVRERSSSGSSESVEPGQPEDTEKLLADKNPDADAPPPKKTEPKPWPSEQSDSPADPKAVFGALDNGMRYMILPNTEPPNRLSIRLHIAAGSLMEKENQRGLAHFLEHMVFNGTKSYKDANALIREMQTRGIAFGAHVNAYTSFDETVYMLDLPDLEENTMDLTFGIMRDFGDGALLSIEEIDAERGVILSEKRSRDSVSYRMQKKQFETLLPNSLISNRFPIGTEEVIENAPRELFEDFYQKYYVPSKMTFVVVGDVDPGEMEERIKATFGSMSDPETVGEQPDLGTIDTPESLQTHVFSDPELDSTDVSLLLVRPHETLPDTKENRAAKIPVQLANFILNRRFQRLSKVENSPIASGSASKNVWFNELEFGSISATAADDRWQETTTILEQEFRRVLEHGFTEAELGEAKANYLNAYEEAVKRQETRKSDSLATAIARSVNDKTVFTTPETDLEIASKSLEETTAEDVHKAFVKFWEASAYHLVLSTKSADDSAKEELAKIYNESLETAVEPPAARAVIPFGYTEFGEAGTVAETVEVEDLGITQLTLSNNIRINLKKTNFEKNRIQILARIGSGQLTQPADKPMLNALASSVFNRGGLGKHSSDDLSEILAGKNVGSTLSIGEDAFSISAATTPEDQLLQFQLMTAAITDPGYRPEGLWQFQKQIPVLFQNLKHTPAGPSAEMSAWLHGEDSRYMIPTQTELSNYTIEDVKNWLTPELQNGYMEISIVGDFDQEKLVADLLTTLGTLGERPTKPTSETARSREVEFPAPPVEKAFTYESKIPQAVATAIWKTDGLRGNIPEYRRLNVLSDIFGDRIREEIREKLGASYSPNAGATGSTALNNFGYLIGQSIGKPDDIPLLLETMKTIASELAEKGASQDELDRALAPTLSSLEKSLRDNSYWLSTVMSQSQAEPERLDLARNRDKDYKSISLDEINALAKKYYAPSNLHQVSIIPKGGE
ncbi:MAG: M16 family metallopeptidase [Akkermansiaceae bacterium]